MPNFPVTIRALVRLAIGVIVFAVPSAAFADCSHEIIDQAYKGKITQHYSQACYNAAIRIEPVDGSSYSDIDSIIKDAKRADALRVRDASVVSTPSGSSDSPRTQSGNHRSTSALTSPVAPPGSATVGGGRTHAKPAALSQSHTTSTSPTTELGAPSATAHAGDLPVAVIVLGVLASMLVVAGIGGAVLRRRSTRAGS
jgi:cobalamin biosynthesis Mg chelatase CobN